MLDAECDHDIHDKDLLAIGVAFHKGTHYMRESLKPVRVLTDHNNIVTFMTAKDLGERQVQ